MTMIADELAESLMTSRLKIPQKKGDAAKAYKLICKQKRAAYEDKPVLKKLKKGSP